MPIKGITDRKTASFPQLGTLRKGGEKETRSKNGKEYQTYGKDLQGFRFDTDDPEALDAFTTHYGDEPRSVDVYLPFETVDENFETSKEAWSASALQHRCDGETCTRWLDKKTGKYSSEPIPCPGGCKEVGRLKVIIPALRRMVYVVAETHSIHDLVNLTEQLTALHIVRGSLRGIPMILSRRPREISTPRSEGQRARVTKWLMSIEAAPSWVELQLSAMERQALPGAIREPLALPEPVQAIETQHGTMDAATGELVDVTPVKPTFDARAAMLKKIEAMWDRVDTLASEPTSEQHKAAVRKMDNDKLIEYGKELKARLERVDLPDEPTDTELLIEAQENGASYEPVEGEVVA